MDKLIGKILNKKMKFDGIKAFYEDNQIFIIIEDFKKYIKSYNSSVDITKVDKENEKAIQNFNINYVPIEIKKDNNSFYNAISVVVFGNEGKSKHFKLEVIQILLKQIESISNDDRISLIELIENTANEYSIVDKRIIDATAE